MVGAPHRTTAQAQSAASTAEQRDAVKRQRNGVTMSLNMSEANVLKLDRKLVFLLSFFGRSPSAHVCMYGRDA